MNEEDKNIDFDQSIGPWLGRTVKRVDYYLYEAFQKNGLDITKEQMIVLMKLHQEDGINQNKLAALTYRDKSSLARLLIKMETKNYIIRKQNKEDKRINEVFLTENGKELFRRTRPVVKNIIDIMEQGISASEKNIMIKVLKKIQHNFTTSLTLA